MAAKAGFIGGAARVESSQRARMPRSGTDGTGSAWATWSASRRSAMGLGAQAKGGQGSTVHGERHRAGRGRAGGVSRPGKGSFRWVLGWQAALTGRGGLRVWAGGKVRWVWVG